MSVSDDLAAATAKQTSGNAPAWPRPTRALLTALHIALVRLRFLLLLLGVLLLIGYWPTLRNWWDKFTRPAGDPARAAVSPDTEYWCPMCPGVLADWPGKCPVCNMALVRRKRGEAAPLPDGVVARMQFAPYRVQLAGIRTYPAEFRPLVQEVALAGFVCEAEVAPQEKETTHRVSVPAEVAEKDAALVMPGQPAEVASEAATGQSFVGRVGKVATQMTPQARTLRIRLDIDDPEWQLRPGMFVTARLRMPVARLGGVARILVDEWRSRTAVDLLAHALVTPGGHSVGGGIEPLLRMAVQQASFQQGQVLAVPESAVVDTGTRKVVFVERMPGMFDGVEVALGRRCGEFYPVLRGLDVGDRVVTAGAFLLDAETRLNPSVAASYFGAARGPTGKPAMEGTAVPPAQGTLSAEDQVLAARQKICPVTGEPLDSMGGPVKAVIAGRTVFLCCEGCAPALRKDPAKYLAKLLQGQ